MLSSTIQCVVVEKLNLAFYRRSTTTTTTKKDNGYKLQWDKFQLKFPNSQKFGKKKLYSCLHVSSSYFLTVPIYFCFLIKTPWMKQPHQLYQNCQLNSKDLIPVPERLIRKLWLLTTGKQQFHGCLRPSLSCVLRSCTEVNYLQNFTKCVNFEKFFKLNQHPPTKEDKKKHKARKFCF